METITDKPIQSWWLLHLHDASYVLMGVVLLVLPSQDTLLHTGLLGGLLLLAGLNTGLVVIRRSQNGQAGTQWFVLSSLRDSLFGLALLLEMRSPPETVISSLEFWALICAFLQAIQAIFYCLSTRSSGNWNYWVSVNHVVCVVIAGALGFGPVLEPDRQAASLGFVGLILIALGLLQGILTWQLGHSSTR